MFELLYTDDNIRGIKKDRNVNTLKKQAELAGYSDWAIYKPYNSRGQRFHNSTDSSFLICYGGRPGASYWINALATVINITETPDCVHIDQALDNGLFAATLIYYKNKKLIKCHLKQLDTVNPYGGRSDYELVEVISTVE